MPEISTTTKLRVFLASPSDVPDERKRVARIIDAMNKAEARTHGIALALLKWEDTAPGMGRPEQVLLDQLAPEKWDIFIGVLWLRFGSVTGGIDPDTQQPYLSGTEEEFKIAYRLNQARGDGFPKIMMYRCRRDPVNALEFISNPKNIEQFNRVNAFFAEFKPPGNYPGLRNLCASISTHASLNLSRRNVLPHRPRHLRRHLQSFRANQLMRNAKPR